jgi:TolB-like protein/DNA-binding SARP family transcriptional activator
MPRDGPESSGAWRLRLTLFGRMDAWSLTSDRVLPRGRKARAALALLALRAADPEAAPIPRAELSATLWSRVPDEQARASLRQAILELSHALSPCGEGLLQVERDRIRLVHGLFWADAAAALAATPDRPEAASLAAQPLLPELRGLDPALDRVLAAEQARMSDHAMGVARTALAAAADGEARLAAVTRLFDLDPAAAEAAIALLSGLAAAGRMTEALDAHRRHRAVLAARGASPLAEVERIAAGLGRPGPRPAPPVLPRRGVRIGVRPLTLLGEETPAHLAEALSVEIAGSLARFRWLFVADAVSLAASDAAARGLDVLLSGSVQRAGGRVRLSLRLADAGPQGRLLWSERLDADATDLLALQDEAAARVVARLDPELLLIESRRAAERRIADPDAYDLLLRAIPALSRLDRGEFLGAGTALEDAARRDPGFAAIHAWRAYWHLLLVGQGWAEDHAVALAEADACAARAVALDPSDAQAITIRGHVRAYLHHAPEEGLALHRRALALNPNLAMAWVFAALADSYCGRHEAALVALDRYRALAPAHPLAFFFDAARPIALLFSGREAEAAAEAERVAALNPAFSSALRIWLCALGLLGRDGADVRGRLLAIEPRTTVADCLRRAPLTARDRERYAEGLRRAGLPEA